MIISHQHSFIFVAIPKTGTHSVRQALREQLGAGDHEQVGLFTQKSLPFPEIAALKHGHISLRQIRPFLGEEAFARYFKFAFVRNPFDGFVSYCAFMSREDDSFKHRPREVMRYFLFKERPLNHLLFQPQYMFIADEAGALLTDAVGRVEEMQTSYDTLCKRMNIGAAILDRVNSSSRQAYAEYYDKELIDGVTQLYERDLDLFGYRFAAD